MKTRPVISFLFYVHLLLASQLLLANVGGVSGSNQFTVSSNGSSTTWKIVSASVTGDAVFTGSVASRGTSDGNITFSTGLDESNNTTYPFFASGSFNKDVQVPSITPTISGGALTALTISYGDGYNTNLSGFTNAPEIIVSPSDGGGTTAEVTANLGTGLNSGKIDSYTISSGGSSYTNTPDVSLVGGPHFVRIISEDSSYFGRVFLIKNNTRTTLELDLDSSVVAGESSSAASTFFDVGTRVEVVPAATLQSVFGCANNLVSGWVSSTSYRRSTIGDSVFLSNGDGSYSEYIHVDYSSSSRSTGWYMKSSSSLRNNTIIYPDEAMIIAKKKNGTTTFDVDVINSDAPARLFIPEYGGVFCANNPYGMKMLLGELIPSTSVGTGADKFKPGATADSDGIDTISILGDSGWDTYYYKTGDNDGGITELMKVGARSGSGGSNALVATDLFVDSGTVTDLESCSDAAGSNTVVNYNDGNYTKISISGSAQSNLTGFNITISDIQGYMLNDDGTAEQNASTGESVDVNGTGSVIYSNIIGTHTVVGHGSGFVVVEKQRDVNFKSNEGSPSWNIGDLGTGYDGTASWWAIGGNGTGAKGTITTGGSVSVTSGGSGYTSAPQIVVSGGGWRISTDGTAPQGGKEIDASDGIIIMRRNSSGTTAYIELPSVSN